jgi:cytochrome b involved in lipid metabolism
MKIVIIIFGIAVLAVVGVAIFRITSHNSAQPAQAKTFSADEVAQHSSESDCWLIIDKKVYNVTSFISVHPGSKEILRGCGKDATSLFEQRTDSNGQPVGSGQPHSDNARQILQELYIGDLALWGYSVTSTDACICGCGVQWYL